MVSSVNFPGYNTEVVSYGVEKETGLIDYNQMRDVALRERPKMMIAGFSRPTQEI